MQIHLGALAPPLKKQFPRLGTQRARHLQACADAASLLRITGLVSWKEGERIYERLAKKIAKEAQTKLEHG